MEKLKMEILFIRIKYEKLMNLSYLGHVEVFLLKPFQNLRRIIRDDNVGARASHNVNGLDENGA